MYIIQQSACERFFLYMVNSCFDLHQKVTFVSKPKLVTFCTFQNIENMVSWFFCWLHLLHLYQIPLVSPQNNASCFDLPGVSYRKVDPTHALGALAVAVEPTWRGCTWGLGCWRRPSSFLRLGSVYQHSGREFIFSTVQVSRKQVVGRRTYVASFCCYLELGTFSETRV